MVDKIEPPTVQQADEAEKKVEKTGDNHSSDLNASLWDKSNAGASKADNPVAKSPTSTPELVITDSKGNNLTPTAEKAATDAPRKIQDKVDNRLDQPLQDANVNLLKAADEAVNKSIYRLPTYIKGLPEPSSDLGCVSSFSDRYRRALELSGNISSMKDTDYRQYYQVNMTDLKDKMIPDGLLQRIPKDEVKEGDVIMGFIPHTTTRHMGIVGRVENGVRQVYDNYGGIFRKESLDGRFSRRYTAIEYYRAYLPPKK